MTIFFFKVLLFNMKHVKHHPVDDDDYFPITVHSQVFYSFLRERVKDHFPVLCSLILYYTCLLTLRFIYHHLTKPLC